MKALIVNRIGDFGLCLGIFAIFFVFGAVDYSTVFSTASDLIGSSFLLCGVEFDALTVICFFLFVGAVGKSAQIGLHTWLPDAMEGPTPVSALIHAATMVLLPREARRPLGNGQRPPPPRSGGRRNQARQRLLILLCAKRAYRTWARKASPPTNKGLLVTRHFSNFMLE